MNWMEENMQKVAWNGQMSHQEEKQRVAQAIAEKVKDGDVIGFGSGSTSLLATQAIAKKVKEENLHITAIPTSYEINILCVQLGIPTTTLLEAKPDWSFDGADEVNANNWLIKGRGGAMFREKLNIVNSNVTYILVDNSKFVEHLCDTFPIPIECHPYAIHSIREKLFELGAESVEMRLAKGKDGPVITEAGNIIVDAIFRNVQEDLEVKLKSIVGVIETGLFIGYNVIIQK